MKSFKGFLSEDEDMGGVPVVTITKWATDLNKEYTLVELNRSMAQELSIEFVNPYGGLMAIKKVLAGYGIELPRVHLHQQEGEEVFAIRQFGVKSGVQTNVGAVDVTNITPPSKDADPEHYLHFTYKMQETGFFKCTAKIVTEDEIDALLSGNEENISFYGQRDARQPQ